MSHELMTRFLEGLHASRLLDTDRIEELLLRPEPPQGDMDGVARFLEGSGWLTRYQIDEIREGRGTTLTFSGYRLLERLPDFPSGPAYRAFHPALQKSVVLRWINREWIEPYDNLSVYIQRAQAASLLHHPYILATLDAGIVNDRPFIVQELVDGADLASLVKEMGALPVPLACEYIRQAAGALHAGAERGIIHGDLAPARLLLTPVIRKPGVNGTGQTVSTRPAPGAGVKLCELGLAPARPPLSEISVMHTALLGEYAFAAPERLTQSVRNSKSDIWSLGATMYFLLAARPPFPGSSAIDTLQQLQQGEPLRVDKLRNDVPVPLADFLHRMLSRDPGQRPESAGAIAQFLAPFCQVGAAPVARPIATPSVPLASETGTIPNARPIVAELVGELPLAEPLPHIEPLPEWTSESQVVRPASRAAEPLPEERHETFETHHGGHLSSLPPKPQAAKGGSSWIILAILLHLIPISAAVLYFTDTWPFGRPVSSSNTQEESKPDDGKKNPKKLKNPSKL